MRQPSPCVRAVCKCVALLPSRKMTCVRPRCNATPNENFLHTSQFRHNILHFTSHTSSRLKPHFSNLFFLHKEFFTHRNQEFLHIDFFLHREGFTHSNPLLTASFWHREVFTHRSFYIPNLTENYFYSQQVFTLRNCYIKELTHGVVHTKKIHAANFDTDKFLHNKKLHWKVLTANFCTQKLLQQLQNRMDLDAKAEKNTILKVFFIRL